MTPELLPTRARFRPGEPVAVEVRGCDLGTMTVRHLGEPVVAVLVGGDGVVDLGPLPAGGYGIELGAHRTAVEVTADPHAPLRYGFVVDYRPGRDPAGVADNLRRLHLSAVQFYDWAYRHAELLGGGEQYADALGQPVSLDTVRALVRACHEVGARSLGYAAVYAAGPDEWPKWEHDALLTPGGPPYALGDFLFLLDPAAPDWVEHFGAELGEAVARLGFDGFHLDQYGYPKHAQRADGTAVDVAASFTTLVAAVRERLPEACLVFNNVNDFPTWESAATPQDAVYIEAWEPQLTLGHLAQTVTRARSVAAGKPVVVAAYQHVYDTAPASAADRAARLTMATLFSHGATHLLCGEADRLLVDPYYVRNHTVEPATAAMLRHYYDFAVEHTELLFAPGIVEVTSSFAAGYNDDLDVRFADARVEQLATAGTVWRRVNRVAPGRYAVHLVNLCGQVDTEWDAPRAEPADPGTGVVRVRRAGPGPLPRVRCASPDGPHRLTEVAMTADGDWATGTLPTLAFWQLVLVELDVE